MGFIATITLVSAFGLLALRPPMPPRHSSPWNVHFALGFLIDEQPFLGLYGLAAGTVATLAAGRCRHATVVALGRRRGRAGGRPHRACRPAARRTPRLDSGAPQRTWRSPPAARGGTRPLLYRLASHGWLCVSTNYRLTPHASYGGRVIDVKRVIAWVPRAWSGVRRRPVDSDPGRQVRQRAPCHDRGTHRT